MGSEKNLKRKLLAEFGRSHSSRKVEESVSGTSRFRSIHDGKETVYTRVNESARRKVLDVPIPPLAPLPLQSEAVQSTSKESVDEEDFDEETQVCSHLTYSFSFSVSLTAHSYRRGK